MRFTTLASAFIPVAMVAAQEAKMTPEALGNPKEATYTAVLPRDVFDKEIKLSANIEGSVHVEAAANNIGVLYLVRFKNLPKEGGPFTYHIHDRPVPEDGNCTETLAHLDPTNRGEMPPCNSSSPQSCQLGDLSGKYGKISEDPFEAKFFDPFTSLKADNPAFVGNRSVTIHFSNKTRITCANFNKRSPSRLLPLLPSAL